MRVVPDWGEATSTLDTIVEGVAMWDRRTKKRKERAPSKPVPAPACDSDLLHAIIPKGHVAAPKFPAELPIGAFIAFKFNTGWETGKISGTATKRPFTHSVDYDTDLDGKFKWAKLSSDTYWTGTRMHTRAQVQAAQ